MTLIATETLTPTSPLTPQENKQAYCGLDCCVTLEVFEELSRQQNSLPAIYSFERALQAPYLEMMQRGFRVNDLARRAAAKEMELRITDLRSRLDEFAKAVWDRGLNQSSYPQLKEFFYQRMKLPEVWVSSKGVRRVSCNREALEKIEEKYLYARPFVSLILSIRELMIQLNVFEREISYDSRYHTSYNIAGTETGRPSSSEDAFGMGGPAQNIAPSLRYIFEADEGKKLCVIDLEQVEARDVGFFCGCLFNDWSYLNACESGDLHSNNTKLVWRHLTWPNNPAELKTATGKNFYRDFSYRDMSKRGGHLTNYDGKAWTMSRALKIPLSLAEEFQARYCRGRTGEPSKGIEAIEPAYPVIPLWWQWTAEQLQLTQQLITPFGRRRHFFGRPGDDATLREAIAYLPQGTTADRMNLGLWRVWRYMPEVQLLAQTYDSITFQYDEGPREDEIVGRALELIRVELKAPNGRSYVVPGEAKIGWNWGNEVTAGEVARARASDKRVPRMNLEGLRKWRAGKRDERQRRVGLSRVMES